MKVINIGINDYDLKCLNSGTQLNRYIDDIYLKIYNTNEG